MTALTPGTRLGPYEIVSLLGVGGMGEVYRARDTKLGRDVAIKTLPVPVAADPGRLARFKREAQLLASLNHPNIGAIYGFEDSSSVHALVLELIEGPTLADALTRSKGRGSGLKPKDHTSGVFATAEALSMARQIADALEAAHDQGIIHRDLKPANIKLRPDGTVKVLDFGLAKALDLPASDPACADLSGAQTSVDPAITCAGGIVGTAAYMSPEQARGDSADARADIWAFGCVLFEMLTGRRAFAADSAAETMAAVLARDPEWDRLPPETPEPVRRLLRRCLNRDLKQRLRHISDARIEIQDALSLDPRAVGPAPASAPARSGWALTAAIASIAALAAAGLAWSLKPATSAPERSADTARVLVEPAEPLVDVENPIAVSTDGRQLAYIAGRGAARRVFVRRLDQYDSKPVPGTEGADFPAFSPDGRWLAFVADRKLKKVELTGGTPFVLCEVTESAGVSWRQAGTILFSAGRSSGIRSISASGGTPTEITKLEPTETYHRHPDALPDGSGLLFTDIAGSGGQQIHAQSLKTGVRRRLAAGAGARYLSTGHVVYASGNTLYAIPFDIGTLEVTGQPVALFEGVALSTLSAPQFAVSDAGTMVYLSSSGPARDALVWVDQNGNEKPAGPPTEEIHFPRLSPNGRRVSVIMGAAMNNSGDVRLYDFARETWNRFTSDNNVTFAIWPPDGLGLTLGSTSDGRYRIETRTLDGALKDSLLSEGRAIYPLSWSPDGQHLAIVMIGASTGQDMHVVNRETPGKPVDFLVSRFREGAQTFSPDGKWIAYVSDKSGRSEIYMRPFPGPGEEWTLSTDGGSEPKWAATAPLLFYRQDDAMMVIDVAMTPTVAPGKPRRVFERRYQRTAGFWPNYNVTADGQQLLMIKRLDQRAPSHINVVVNWLDELKRQIPTR